MCSPTIPASGRSGCPAASGITDAEVICLLFLRLARGRLGHLFGYIPGQSGFNKRVRALGPEIARLLDHLARSSPSACDNLRLIDATPIKCAASRETSGEASSPAPPPMAGAQCTRATLGLHALPACRL
jgi:hypothetical protein